MKIGFAGMSHLGLVMSSVMAERADKVVCFDINRDSPDLENIYEPGLSELIATNGDKQQFTNKASALGDCELVYVTADVSDHSDLKGVLSYCSIVFNHIRDDVPVVIVSQVPPGFTRKQADSWKSNPVFYQIDTLVFGKAVEVARSPERYVIGCMDFDKPLPEPLSTLHKGIAKPVFQTTYEAAEITKMAVNAYLATSITLANYLAFVCSCSNANWADVEVLMKSDPRIGVNAYLSAGLGIGGGHMMRDVIGLNLDGIDSSILTAVRMDNAAHKNDWLFDTWKRFRDTKERAAIWGLAYKPGTNSIVDSPGVSFAEYLMRFGKNLFKVHDPIVRTDRFTQCDDPLEAAKGAQILFITCPWDHYRHITLSEIKAVMADDPVIVDPYRVYELYDARTLGFTYETLGWGEPHASN